MKVITKDSSIVLHFSLSFDEARVNVIDSTLDQNPATLVLGKGILFQEIEEHLIGMKEGEECSVMLSPEQAFGVRNPKNIHYFSRHQFHQDMVLEKNLVVSFADVNNKETYGVVKEFNHQSVLIDFNHPLAGRTLFFYAQILNISDQSADENAVKLMNFREENDRLSIKG